MTLEEFIATHGETLGAVWLAPQHIDDLLALRVAGTDNGFLLEPTWVDASGEHTEVWTLPDAYRLDHFRLAPAGASGGYGNPPADHRGG
jgi:hypothetical protein